MKLTVSIDLLSPKAIAAMSSFHEARDKRIAAEAALVATRKKEAASIAQLKALGIQVTVTRSEVRNPVAFDPPAGMLLRRDVAQRLGIAQNTVSSLIRDGHLRVSEKARASNGSRLNLFAEADVEALRLKRDLAAKAKSSGTKATVKSSPAPALAPASAPVPVGIPAPEPTPAPKPVSQQKTVAPQKPVALPRRIDPPPKPTLAPRPEPAPVRSYQAPAPVAPPVPEVDINESGRFEAEERGKRVYKSGFVVGRNTQEATWQWEAFVSKSELAEGFEIFETWRKSGMGRWESTPADPGRVGMGVGVANTGPLVGKSA